LAIVCIVATWDAPAAEGGKPSKADRKKAIALFKDSQTAYQEGRFRDAADLLERAYALDPNPTLLFNLARALESTGNAEKTIDAYERYLAADPNAKDRPAIEQRIQNLKAQIEKSQLLERQAEEERKRREALEESERIAPPPPPILPPPPLPPIEPPRSPSPWPWVILGLGAAGAGAGGVLGVMAATKQSKAEDEPVQETAADLDATAHSFAMGANIAYGVGGGIALAGLIWGIIDLTSGGSSDATAVVTPSPAGVAGRF
jgi:tetratricopeptide (TPR) repeat protein